MGNPIKNEYDNILGIAEDDALTKEEKKEYRTAIFKLQENIHQRPVLSKELQTYRRYVPLLIKGLQLETAVADGYAKMIERYITNSEARKNKRWLPEEDEVLVNMVCDDNSIFEISLTLGRTPASIKTRLSNLVGTKRISKNIAGKFIGKIDGILTECEIEGTVFNGKHECFKEEK